MKAYKITFDEFGSTKYVAYLSGEDRDEACDLLVSLHEEGSLKKHKIGEDIEKYRIRDVEEIDTDELLSHL